MGHWAMRLSPWTTNCWALESGISRTSLRGACSARLPLGMPRQNRLSNLDRMLPVRPSFTCSWNSWLSFPAGSRSTTCSPSQNFVKSMQRLFQAFMMQQASLCFCSFQRCLRSPVALACQTALSAGLNSRAFWLFTFSKMRVSRKRPSKLKREGASAGLTVEERAGVGVVCSMQACWWGREGGGRGFCSTAGLAVPLRTSSEQWTMVRSTGMYSYSMVGCVDSTYSTLFSQAQSTLQLVTLSIRMQSVTSRSRGTRRTVCRFSIFISSRGIFSTYSSVLYSVTVRSYGMYSILLFDGMCSGRGSGPGVAITGAGIDTGVGAGTVAPDHCGCWPQGWQGWQGWQGQQQGLQYWFHPGCCHYDTVLLCMILISTTPYPVPIMACETPACSAKDSARAVPAPFNGRTRHIRGDCH